MTDTWISDDMRSAVGAPIHERVSFPISASDIRKWAQAVYYPEAPPPWYWDEDHEVTRRMGGLVAPEEFNPFAWMTAAGPSRVDAGTGPADVGPERQLGIAPPATHGRLNGGIEVTYTGVRMRPGDVIRSVESLAEYREQPGRLGLMLFTFTEQQWTNQSGALVKTQRSTLIRY